MSLFPEVTTPPAHSPEPASRLKLTTERPDVGAAIAEGKARRAAAKVEAAARKAALPAADVEDAPFERQRGGRPTSPQTIADLATLRAGGEVPVPDDKDAQRIRRAGARVGLRFTYVGGVARLAASPELAHKAASKPARTSSPAAASKSSTPLVPPPLAPKAVPVRSASLPRVELSAYASIQGGALVIEGATRVSLIDGRIVVEGGRITIQAGGGA